MSRRRAREVAMQALFQLDLNNYEINSEIDREKALKAAWEEGKTSSQIDQAFADSLVKGVSEHLAEIDTIIKNVSVDWKIERMSVIDRNILRLAVFEIKWGDEDVNVQIAINEAVELAKKFGTDDSARFVNGVLGAVVKA